MKHVLLSLIFLSVFMFEASAQVTLFDPIQAPSAGMAAQAQQFNQQMAAFMQSQAAGHGEGGLGLAKGDG